MAYVPATPALGCPHSLVSLLLCISRYSFLSMGQVGIFRKSGVKSRIQSLRQMNETSPDNVCYEGQSAYDVADLLKQYFRDLPEPIFTSKLTTTFLQIYQRKSPVPLLINLPRTQPA